MALKFYPHTEGAQKGTNLEERVDILMEGAERYKAIILDGTAKAPVREEEAGEKKRAIPRDQLAAYNWEAIAHVLREVRDMPEGTRADKAKKAEVLTKLAEVYEVLRAAKMSKLEAVRVALVSEANQLRGGTSQVA